MIQLVVDAEAGRIIVSSDANGSTRHGNVDVGEKLYDSEQDYIGLGALDPDDPHIIYISTPFDPRDDTTNLGQHESWKGVTCDDGATFTWTPVTMNSGVDNLAPRDAQVGRRQLCIALFRGSYATAQSYDEEVVGIVAPG